LQSVNKVFLPE